MTSGSWRRLGHLAWLALGAFGARDGDASEPVMTASDLAALEQPAPDQRLPYGAHELHFGELRLPEGGGPFPAAVLIHGGCWLAEYDLGYMSALAEALAGEGIATWSIEYRRVGDQGGGWPGTFADVAAAADMLRSIAADHPLDLERVVAVGHSAGGHLALWLAARPRLEAGDALRGSSPLPIAAVVALAGIPDLAAYSSSEGCGAAVPGLLGGAPTDHPERLRRASPIEMAPSGVPETLIIGAHDSIVPRSQAEDYRARRGAWAVEILEIESAGHFELIVPGSAAWPAVRGAVLAAVGRQ